MALRATPFSRCSFSLLDSSCCNCRDVFRLEACFEITFLRVRWKLRSGAFSFVTASLAPQVGVCGCCAIHRMRHGSLPAARRQCTARTVSEQFSSKPGLLCFLLACCAFAFVLETVVLDFNSFRFPRFAERRKSSRSARRRSKSNRSIKTIWFALSALGFS